jgi:iron(III) transport system permease protein
MGAQLVVAGMDMPAERRVSAKTLILASAALALVTAGLVPVVGLLAHGLLAPGQIGYLERFVDSPQPWLILGRSIAVAGLTTLITLMLGLPLGILLGRTDLPLRRMLVFLFTIPLVIPPYILAVLWFYLLGRQGLAGRLFGPWVAERTAGWLFGLPGCVLVLSTVLLPVVILLVIVLLRTVNPRLEEAGTLVAGWPRVLRGITLPLILPGILLAAILVFLLSFGEFGVPMFLRYDVFPVEAFTRFTAFLDQSAAAAASYPLILVTLLLLILEHVYLGSRTTTLRPLLGNRDSSLVRLRRARKWAFALCCFLCLVLVLLPLSVMCWEALSGGAMNEAFARAQDSLGRSLIYAGMGATLLTIVGFFLGYSIHNRALRFWRSIDWLTVFLLALPSTVIGIGMVTVWNHPATRLIYSTPAILLLGYLAQYSAIASRISASTLAQMPAAMEEAAQVAGAGWLRRFARIVVPLSWKGIVGAWLISFIFCLRDTGISMMVYPPGHDTLPVRIFTLMANGSTALVASLCLLMSFATVIPLALGGLFLYYHGRRARI